MSGAQNSKERWVDEGEEKSGSSMDQYALWELVNDEDWKGADRLLKGCSVEDRTSSGEG